MPGSCPVRRDRPPIVSGPEQQRIGFIPGERQHALPQDLDEHRRDRHTSPGLPGVADGGDDAFSESTRPGAAGLSIRAVAVDGLAFDECEGFVARVKRFV